MKEQLNKPKGFGEILDLTFSLSKKKFSDLFLIMLVLVGPIYLLQAIIQMADGVSFFRHVGSGNVWYEQILNSINTTEGAAIGATGSLGANLLQALLGLISVLLFLVAQAAVIFTVNHIRKDEDYSTGSVIKQAFSRFWPLLGSSILYFLIYFGLIIALVLIVAVGGIFIMSVNTASGVIFMIIFGIGALVTIVFLLVRWSFYFGSVILDKESPGFSRSWGLTRKRTWTLIGMYIILFLIISVIVAMLQGILGLLLGGSVLFLIIVNIATLVTTMIFTVGYAVMYLDSRTRHDADDLKELVQDYNAGESHHVTTE